MPEPLLVRAWTRTRPGLRSAAGWVQTRDGTTAAIRIAGTTPRDDSGSRLHGPFHVRCAQFRLRPRLRPACVGRLRDRNRGSGAFRSRDASRRELRRRVPAHARVSRPRGGDRHGEVGPRRAKDFRDPGQRRHAFVLPSLGEASHGDLGMLTEADMVVALSNSGETDEILTILPIIKRLGIPLVTLTGADHSRLASEADVNIDVSVEQEACPLGLAPTASTTAALAMGDALAIALLEARGFSAEDFARSHPGGRLGRRLLLHIADVMHTGADVPRVLAGATVSSALVEMTRSRLGMTAVVDDTDRVLGVFTDGDLRRAIENDVDMKRTRIDEVMTRTASPSRRRRLRHKPCTSCSNARSIRCRSWMTPCAWSAPSTCTTCFARESCDRAIDDDHGRTAAMDPLRGVAGCRGHERMDALRLLAR